MSLVRSGISAFLMPFVLALAGFMVLPAPATAGEAVIYQDGDTILEGYWAETKCFNEQSAPVVLVIHQWMGLTNYEKARAEMLAEECYNAFAIDMYGQGIRPESSEQASELAGRYKNDPDLARQRLRAAVDYARRKGDLLIDYRMGAIGYCFGGTMALELARSGADVAGVVSFHGGLTSKAPLKEPGIIKPAIQIHHGAADPHVPPADVETFRDEMKRADAELYFSSYADAVHAFTQPSAGNDPSTGVAYNEMADEISWAATLAFLDEVLGPDDSPEIKVEFSAEGKSLESNDNNEGGDNE